MQTSTWSWSPLQTLAGDRLSGRTTAVSTSSSVIILIQATDRDRAIPLLMLHASLAAPPLIEPLACGFLCFDSAEGDGRDLLPVRRRKDRPPPDEERDGEFRRQTSQNRIFYHLPSERSDLDGSLTKSRSLESDQETRGTQSSASMETGDESSTSTCKDNDNSRAEFKPIEHPLEPSNHDRPIRCPLPDPSILNARCHGGEGEDIVFLH
ncbi:hypothetical protein ZIOFF_058280 [Zingiber officinale]|uniref:Uncharacterized protein n=1 Tax=Zingiber officinale TaxID=94328 RepID=A0A8J5F3M9_ZINOF|nr:hypothetical protein ZIOFF_058280 [Zingiber officinale]